MVVASRNNIDLFNPSMASNYPLSTAFSFSSFNIEKQYLNSMTTERHYYIAFNLELTLYTRVSFEKNDNVSYNFINNNINFTASNSVSTKLVYANKLSVPIRLDFDFFENDISWPRDDRQACRTVFKAYDYDYDTAIYSEALGHSISTRRSMEAVLIYAPYSQNATTLDIHAMFNIGAMGQNLNLEYTIKDLQHNFPTNCLTIITNPVISPYVVEEPYA